MSRDQTRVLLELLGEKLGKVREGQTEFPAKRVTLSHGQWDL